MRPIWKGYITFGLVTIPVILYSAEKKSDIRFKLVDSRDKARIRYVRVNEHTGEEVPWEEIAKGYEYDDQEVVLITESDIKDIAGENTKTINIESFVNKEELDIMDFETPYYLVPDKKGDKGYVILRETLKTTDKVGIARVIIHTRQYLAALMSYKNALVLNILRYHQEIRKPSEFDLPTENIKNYKISPKEIEIAKQLVASMTDKWNPNDYQDEIKIAMQQLIDSKIHHKKPKQKLNAPVKKSNVVDFVDILKKSIKEKSKKKKPIASRSKRKSAGARK